jgi:DHA1 family multidrug resistance protein-like MFS transporter
MALISPVWGAISDRHGRKLMVERAMFGGVLVMVLMGLARTPLQLVLLRMLQGLLTGTVTAATTLVASIAPRERTGYALGVLQMGIYVGASLGPLTGGLIADTLGFQFAFWTTGGLLLVGGLLVALLVKENFVPPPPTERRRGWTKSLGRLLSSRPILSAFSVRLVMRLGSQMLGPILPLFVQSLAAGGLVATLSGTVQG